MGHGILLIEDEEVLAKNIKRYLDRQGYEDSVHSQGMHSNVPFLG